MSVGNRVVNDIVPKGASHATHDPCIRRPPHCPRPALAARLRVGLVERPEARRDERQQRRGEHIGARRLSDPVAGRPQPVHGIEQAGRRGGLDIWVATRSSASASWGAPQNLGEPVNSAADDFCPTPVGKNGLFFVSREALPGVRPRRHLLHPPHRRRGLGRAEQLLCSPQGRTPRSTSRGLHGSVNGKLRGKKALFFSRSSVTPSVAGDIFVSEREKGARFGPATAVAELNDAAANDIQPNVRADGLEVVFTSNRAGGSADRTSGRRRARV